MVLFIATESLHTSIILQLLRTPSFPLVWNEGAKYPRIVSQYPSNFITDSLS